MFEHIKENHKEVYDIHKNSTEGAVGFQIEFLHLLKDDGDPKSQPMILGQVCETMTGEISKTEPKNVVEESVDLQYVLIPRKKKKGQSRLPHGKFYRAINLLKMLFSTTRTIVCGFTIDSFILKHPVSQSIHLRIDSIESSVFLNSG